MYAMYASFCWSVSGYQRQKCLFWQTSPLCIVMKLARGGSVAVAVGVVVAVSVAVFVFLLAAVAVAVEVGFIGFGGTVCVTGIHNGCSGS